MANIDHDRKRITAVLLFYGPAGAGKTTSLYALARHLPPGTHGKVAPLQQGDDRLLRLDYRPHDHEMVYGYQLSFRLVTCPGQTDVDLVRPVLAAADAVMFVADSASNSLNANLGALEDLDRMARSCGRRLDDLPIVFMYNKRDLRDALEIRLLENRLNRFGSNYLAASAIRGQGVLEALQRLTATVAVQLRTELASAPGVKGSTHSTVAHGKSFEQARNDGQDLDDVTAVSVERGPAAVGSWQEGSDDRTEVNPTGGGWEVDEPIAGRGVPSHSSMRSVPQDYGRRHPSYDSGDQYGSQGSGSYGSGGYGGAGGGRPGFGGYGGGASFRSEPSRQLPRQHAPQPAPEPVYSDQSWRTPDAFADIDSDDHTMPYMDFDQEVGEVPQNSQLAPPPPDRRGGPAAATSMRRPASSPRGPAHRAPQRGRPMAGGRGAFEPRSAPRRVDPARVTGSMRNVPSSGSLRGVPPGSVRGMPSSDSMRAPQGSGTLRGPSGAPVEPPQATQSQTGAKGGTGTFTKTMAINALGREAEPWEMGIEQSGHQVKLQAPDLSGYVVSRIGTPKAASRRTVRIPVRATHMDTLVPQDFVIDVEFRGGQGGSPAVSARKTPQREGRSVPLAWVIAIVGALLLVVAVLWVALYLNG